MNFKTHYGQSMILKGSLDDKPNEPKTIVTVKVLITLGH